MRSPSLTVVFLTVFIDLIGFGIVLPLLPRYVEKFGASGFMIGVIISSFSVMQFLFAPAWGRLSDRVGRRPVLLISNFGSVVSYLLFALATWDPLASHLNPTLSVLLLLASRVFAGICGANLSVASAYIADITPPDKRSKSMGLIGVAFGLGFILGPALGALSARHWGLAGPGWVAAGLCLVNFLLACFILAESRKPNATPTVRRIGLAQWGHVLRQPKVGLLIGLFTLSTFCFACYESTIPLLMGSPQFHPGDFIYPRALANKLATKSDPLTQHLRTCFSPDFIPQLIKPGQSDNALRQQLNAEFNRCIRSRSLIPDELSVAQGIPAQPARHSATEDDIKHNNRMKLEKAYPAEIRRQGIYLDEQHIGYLFAFCGLISVFIQGGVIGRLIRRFGEPRIIQASLVILAISLAAIPYAGSMVWLLLATGAFSAGAAINRAPTMGLISLHTHPSEQGATMGVAQSASTLARIVAPIFATTLYSFQPHSPYLISSFVAAITAWIAWNFLRHEPSTHQQAGAKEDALSE